VHLRSLCAVGEHTGQRVGADRTGEVVGVVEAAGDGKVHAGSRVVQRASDVSVTGNREVGSADMAVDRIRPIAQVVPKEGATKSAAPDARASRKNDHEACQKRHPRVNHTRGDARSWVAVRENRRFDRAGCLLHDFAAIRFL